MTQAKATNPQRPRKAMVLAAGRGLRMRPITDKLPKPLVKVRKRTLIDRVIDRLIEAGIEEVVVNTHHLGHLIEEHLSKREDVTLVFSSEEGLLETGGGVKHALPLLGDDPFWVVNSDTLWLNGYENALERLLRLWNPAAMDAMLMLHSTVDAYGYRGNGDFTMDSVGRLQRRPEREVSPLLFTGVQIIKPQVFEDTPDGAWSLNVIYDKLIETERLFGIVHDGEWFHIGTPDGLAEAEQYLEQRYAETKHR